jgi:Domain of unknown function (DUF4357)
MAHGVTLRIFLPEGNPEGLRVVTKSNWSGLAIASSRARYLAVRQARKEFRTPGVYVLVGPPESADREARVYVGQAEDPRKRLDSHHAEKDFWTRVILFTASGQVLNKADIAYLEARLLELAATAKRAELDNGQGAALPTLNEPDREDAESYLSDMLLIYPLLGLNVFEPLEETAKAERLTLRSDLASGEGAVTEDGFVVFAGARARPDYVGSIPSGALGIREALISSGALVPDPASKSLVLQDDHEFKSPSAAAGVLLGRSVPGPLAWESPEGKSLKQIREEAVED